MSLFILLVAKWFDQSHDRGIIYVLVKLQMLKHGKSGPFI